MDDFMYGVASGQALRARGAMNAVAILERGLDERDAWIVRLQAELATMKERAALAEATAAGRSAQVSLLLTETANATWKAPSGRLFKNGRPKSRIRLIYEAAFDSALKNWGISSPPAKRED